MASIGGITVYSLAGFEEDPALEVEDISRPGVDGVAYRRLHSRGEPYQMLAKQDCENIAGATAAYTAFKELQGTLVTTVNDYGSTSNNVMVEHVRRVAQFKLLSAVGGVSTLKGAFLVVVFTLRRTVG